MNVDIDKIVEYSNFCTDYLFLMPFVFFTIDGKMQCCLSLLLVLSIYRYFFI